MSLLIAFVLAFAFSYFLRKPIRSVPWVFYLLALALDAIMLSGVFNSISPVAFRVVFTYLTRCLFAFGLLTIVMIIGILPEESGLKKKLRPIRGELSIISSILVAGHVVQYFDSMIIRMFTRNSAMTAGTFWGTMLSLVLVVLLVVLMVTSFKFVRNAMKPAVWKKIQIWAYPFYLLCFAHLFAMLLPSAVAGGNKAILSVIIYSIVMAIYCVGRIIRAVLDKKHGGEKEGGNKEEAEAAPEPAPEPALEAEPEV